MIKAITVFLCMAMVSHTIHGQEAIHISKAEVLAKVNEGNNTLKIIEQTIQAAKGNFQQTNSVFLPNITASYTGISTTNPLMVFGSKLNQEIVTQNDFNPALLNDPSQITNFATKVEIQQPLLNFDGIYQRKAAKASWNSSASQFERTKQQLKLEVEKAYMQLQLAYKTEAVLKIAQKAALENHRLAHNNFKQGNLQQSDLLAVQVRVTEIENQLQYAKSAIANASNYLSLLMNDSSYSILKPSDSLVVASERVFDTETISDDRADLQAMRYASEAYKQNYKADKMTFLPRLNAFGSYELYDDEIFQADANGYLIGAALSWNLLEGTKRFGKAQKSKAIYQKATFEYEQYKAESQFELNQAKRMLQDTKNNIALTEIALEQSKEALRIRTNRFREGLEKTTDLLSSETQFAQKQLDYYTAIFQYNYALAFLEFLTEN